MTKIISAFLVATVVLGAAVTANARTDRNPGWTDESKPYGGFDPNSAQGNRAFWDYQSRHGN